MVDTPTLWLYFLVVSGVILLPGMDMAFVMGSSMAGGHRAGLAAVAGIVSGGICHMLIAASGISVLLKMMPAALMSMLVAGAAYIAWTGWTLLRATCIAAPQAGKGCATPLQSFGGAMATCLLNPKAYVFMLAIFPQFVHVSRGSVWRQAAELSLITAAVQIAVYGALAMLVVQAQSALQDRPRANLWLARAVGLVLILAAGLSLFSGFKNMD
ncbi:MAG: LysE family translocator [Burkholderiales bacterium]|nr:LysE family translocator [Burkholderiales bacterium]